MTRPSSLPRVSGVAFARRWHAKVSRSAVDGRSAWQGLRDESARAEDGCGGLRLDQGVGRSAQEATQRGLE